MNRLIWQTRWNLTGEKRNLNVIPSNIRWYNDETFVSPDVDVINALFEHNWKKYLMKISWENVKKYDFNKNSKNETFVNFSIFNWCFGTVQYLHRYCSMQLPSKFHHFNVETDFIFDFQCSTPVFGTRESCSGNNIDLACCSETEACDLVNAETVACTDLPYLDNAGAARTCKF